MPFGELRGILVISSFAEGDYAVVVRLARRKLGNAMILSP